MGCNCGKPKCDGHCGVSPAVLQINNPSECVLFHRVEVPASMGDSITNPPKPGAYRNTLLYYKADGEAFLYSSDGIPTKITGVANDYACLENKPQINGVTLEGNKSLADIGVTDAINNALQPYTPRSELAEVAFSGSYNDLTDKPDIPSGSHVFYMLNPSVGNAAPIYHDYRRTDQVTLAQFTDAIASGPVQIYIPYDSNTFRIHYVDQMDAFIPDPPMVTGTLYVSFGLRDQYGLGVRRFLWYEPDTAPIFDGYDPNQSDWNQASPTDSSYIKNKPNLATVATSGSYNDLSNKPTIPAAQVNSDWNAASGVAQILNKPSLATVATSGSYNDLTDKPTIPTVNNATLTIQKNGANVQTFTANQSTNATANITVPTKTSDLTNDGATGTSAYIEESDIAPSELSGEGEFVTLEGTTDCSALDTQLNGNTEQTTYSGKNLFNFDKFISDNVSVQGVTRGTATYTSNSITLTATSNDCFTKYNFPTNLYPVITVSQNTDVTLSWKTNNTSGTNKGVVYVFGNNNGAATVIINAQDRAEHCTFNTGSYTEISFRVGVANSGDTLTYSDIQVEIGSAPTAYERFVGGIPAPNPDYPQPISTVTGEQTVKVVGKNLWGGLTAFSTSAGGVNFTNNADGSVTASGTATSNTSSIPSTAVAINSNWFVTLPSGNYTVSAGTLPSGILLQIYNANTGASLGNAQGQFTLTEQTQVYVRIRVASGTTIDATFNIQLELGSTATAYEPYQGQEFSINLGSIELAKIGNYQDRIYKNEGKWYIEKNVGKVVLDGSAGIGQYNQTNNWFYVSYSSIGTGVGVNNGDIMSDYFTGTTLTYMSQHTTENGLSASSSNNIFIRNTDYTTTADYRTWLSTHNATVYYALATPTDTEITDETLIRQLEALAGALGYDGVTNIMSASPVLPAILSVSTYTGSAIPPATRARAGIVRIGDGIEVDDCGTISVNAQKAPTAFTMQYADNLAGWQSGDNYELVKETTGSPTDYIYRANKFYYGGADVSFLNEKTGVVFTPQELYAWLLDGNEAVLNHVPLGWAVDNGAEVLYAGNYIDGIWLKKETIASQSGNTISFNGSAFVTAFIPRTSSYEERAQDTLGIAISGYEDDGAMVYDLISIDGFSLYGSVQESSPII